MATPNPPRRGVVAPEAQSASFVELFFDLVFVFAVTQIVGLLHGGLSVVNVAQAILVFWLVWWAWTQFTWTLNAADTSHTLIELATLLATATAFFMAIALPNAFGSQSLNFAVAYVLVRLIGLAVQLWVAWADPAQRVAARTFSLLSLSGLTAVVVGGLLGGAALFWLWGAAVILDFVAAAAGGQDEGWNLQPEHFAERHGLFVIIALGETLIVAARGMTEASWDREQVFLVAAAVALSCAFWWSYFPQVKPILEHAFAASRKADQGKFARDVYSLLHFLLLCGVVAYAFVIEEAVAHPGEPLPLAVQLTLAFSVLSFVGGSAFAVWRATRRVLWVRMSLILVTVVALFLLEGRSPQVTFATVFGVVALAALYEQFWE